MGAFDRFGTDRSAEAEGVWLDFGDFGIKVSRAGRTNKRFKRAMEVETKPYRRALEHGMLDDKTADKIAVNVFAKTIIMDWRGEPEFDDETGEIVGYGEFLGPDGEPLEFALGNVKMVLRALPELFDTIRDESAKSENFLVKNMAADAKN